MAAGIDDIAIYIPKLFLDATDFANARGMDPKKLEKGLGVSKPQWCWRERQCIRSFRSGRGNREERREFRGRGQEADRRREERWLTLVLSLERQSRTYSMSDNPVRYRRVLLKLSGEALMGDLDYGIEPKVIQRIATDIATVQSSGVEIAIVIGGGNIFRGAGLARAGMDRVTGDHMGMLATVMNALAIQDALESLDVYARVMSALQINAVCEDYIRRRAVRHLEKGRVVMLAAGTGNPFFTTDTAASLRAIEIGADVLLKATKVDGVYDADPLSNPDAKRFDTVSYDQVLSDKLLVMDATAIVMCRDNQLPLRIFDLTKENALVQAMSGADIGTVVTA